MEFIYNDGGRAAAGFKGYVGDCVVRSVAIVTRKPYKEVYDSLNKFIKETGDKKSSARTGVSKKTTRKFIEKYVGKWTPTMKIGSGCQVHLKQDELPNGSLIVDVSRHITAVVNGVLMDTHDCSREGTRCVYGYYKLSEK